MPVSYKRENICEGAYYTEIIDKRFKTNYIYVNFLDPLRENTASENAVIPTVLTSTNEKYPDMMSLSRKLLGLYDSSVSGTVYKLGDCQVMSFMGVAIADKYTIGGEKINGEVTDILIDCITKPYLENGAFAQGNFALKKQELIDCIDAEINDKRTYSSRRASEAAYRGEPAEISLNGKRENAERLTPEASYERYKKLLETAHIEVIFSGYEIDSVTKDKLFSMVRSFERNVPKLSSKFSPLKSEPCCVTENMDVAQSKLVIAFKPEKEAEYPLKLLSKIYGGTPFSLLFENVREKLSLCYYCSTSINISKNTLFVHSGVEQKNIDAAHKEILAQLDRIKKGDISEELIENSKHFHKSALKSIYDSPAAMANWYLMQCLMRDICSPEEEASRIDAVGKDELIAAAKSLKEDTVYVLTGKENSENE